MICMGMMDALNPEDRVNIKFGEFYHLVRNSVSADLMLNGIKNKVDHDSMYKMIKGKPIDDTVCQNTEETPFVD